MTQETLHPEAAQRLQKAIFEGLPESERANWHVAFAEKAETVTDWQSVIDKTVLASLRIAEPHDTSEGKVVATVIGLYERKLAGDNPSNAEWADARAAARAAADAWGAEWAAARAAWAAGAAGAAARAAADTAGAAADTAGAALWAAEASAAAAVREARDAAWAAKRALFERKLDGDNPSDAEWAAADAAWDAEWAAGVSTRATEEWAAGGAEATARAALREVGHAAAAAAWVQIRDAFLNA